MSEADAGTETFRLLAALAVVDRDLAAEERLRLLSAATRLGLAPEEASAIVKEVGKGARIGRDAIPDKAAERRRLLRDLLDLALADDEITPKEWDLLRRVGPAFGLDEEGLQQEVRKAALRRKAPRPLPDLRARRAQTNWKGRDALVGALYVAYVVGDDGPYRQPRALEPRPLAPPPGLGWDAFAAWVERDGS